jgi:hypothetical protein
MRWWKESKTAHSKPASVSLGSFVNCAVLFLTIASLWFAWQGILIARRGLKSADEASDRQTKLFDKQLLEEAKSASDLWSARQDLYQSK